MFPSSWETAKIFSRHLTSVKLKQAEKVLGWDAGIASLVIILAQICSNEMSDDALCFLAPSSFPKLKGKQDFSHELNRCLFVWCNVPLWSLEQDNLYAQSCLSEFCVWVTEIEISAYDFKLNRRITPLIQARERSFFSLVMVLPFC